MMSRTKVEVQNRDDGRAVAEERPKIVIINSLGMYALLNTS